MTNNNILMFQFDELCDSSCGSGSSSGSITVSSRSNCSSIDCHHKRMRTPGSTSTLPPSSATSQDPHQNIKPSTLPGLQHHDHQNNLLHSPDSDTSNR